MAAVTMVLVGCKHSDTATSTSTTNADRAVLKVAVYSDGKITTDGKPVGLDELVRQMESARSSSATVWYYREGADSEPHPNAMKVMEHVVKNKLPISLSTKPDFSDVVGPDGIPRPR